MKKKFNISLDAPVSIIFVVLSIILFMLSTYVFKDKAGGLLLASATSAGGAHPFLASSAASYFRSFLYVFGGTSINAVLYNLIFVLLLGSSLEDYYGSVLVGVCYFITAVFAVVLNACFCKTSLQGCACIVMMVIFLNALMSVSKRKLPVSSILVLVLCIVMIAITENQSGVVSIFINIVAGLCSALIAFIVSPLVHPNQKKEGGLLGKAEKVRKEEFDEPKNKKKKDSTTLIRKKSDMNDSSDDDTTVIGTLKF